MSQTCPRWAGPPLVPHLWTGTSKGALAHQPELHLACLHRVTCIWWPLPQAALPVRSHCPHCFPSWGPKLTHSGLSGDQPQIACEDAAPGSTLCTHRSMRVRWCCHSC